MLKWLRDVVLVPILIAFLFMIWGAWYTGVKWHSPLSVEWFKTVLAASIPLWFFLITLIVGTLGTLKAIKSEKQRNILAVRCSQLESTADENSNLKSTNEQLRNAVEGLEDRLAKAQSNQPLLHGVWKTSQTFWHLGRKDAQPIMQIGGWITLTTSRTPQPLQILAAYIDGHRAELFLPVTVPPFRTYDRQVVLLMLPPLEIDATKPFTATIVLEDQRNVLHELPRHEFRATPPPAPSPFD
jgi:hypothetical protein